MHLPNNTERIEIHLYMIDGFFLRLTLPHDEVNDFFWGSFPSDNSSASPQEQSLHALRFPVVPQTEKKYRDKKGRKF